jgi:hypothetical protein
MDPERRIQIRTEAFEHIEVAIQRSRFTADALSNLADGPSASPSDGAEHSESRRICQRVDGDGVSDVRAWLRNRSTAGINLRIWHTADYWDWAALGCSTQLRASQVNQKGPHDYEPQRDVVQSWQTRRILNTTGGAVARK